MIKKSLLLAANSERLERLVTANRRTNALVSRYVAGTTLDEAIAATRALNVKGIDVSLDLLGETVSELSESAVAAEAYVEAIQRIATDVPGATVSVKLSQLGIGLDPGECQGHLKNLLDAGEQAGVAVEIDMEHSSVGPQTLEAFRAALPAHPQSRVAIQAAMRRTPDDLASFTVVKPRIRLVKGAFLESIDKALRDAAEVTAQYKYLAEWALTHLLDPAFGTHDSSCIEHVKTTAQQLGVDKRDYEFQMLYGVRRDVQQQLADEGHRVRIYLPYGTQWYPYLMRRMAERPANLSLFARSLISG
jgi:proline dehydrogenase